MDAVGRLPILSRLATFEQVVIGCRRLATSGDAQHARL
jgi:hypothetical protein